ncbi:tetratricopeptide repeat protein [Microbacteriaceae bacterium VKM Ac-2854]|nr:tetratricopeptide repeat protein [Microbacteriaceae bacterium VKM Ac-2854]
MTALENPRPGPRLRVLGGVRIDGDELGSRAALLLVALALHGRTVSADALIDAVWVDEPPRNAKAALQTMVSRLRGSAGAELIRSASGGYALALERDEVDLWAVADAASAATTLLSADPGAALRMADDALGVWIAESTGAAHPLRHEIEQEGALLRSRLVTIRAEALLTLGRFAEAVEPATTTADAAPLDEPAQLRLMRALTGAGRTPDALAVFARLRERMRDALGVSPSRELVAANAALLRDEPETPRRRLRVGIRSSPNALLGRDDDIERIEALLQRSRVVTVLGPGGLGKTRLAQEIAGRSSAPAVVVVELASIRDADDVLLAFATALGLYEAAAPRRLGERPHIPSVRARVLAALGENETLLVVDNCEHLVDAVAEWVAAIVSAAPNVRVLATSRSPLEIGAESVYALDPLPSADEASPAVRLFVQRARAARPGAQLPTASIQRLCAHLDGLPLAIELAAARVRSMSVEEIERRLSNRFALLSGGDRSAPERHRTLFAVIDWSWNLLSDAERRVLRRLSRFSDGFGSAAAAAVAADGDAEIGAELEALANQSLITATDAGDGAIRFRMLETVREFGEMALVDAGDDIDVRGRMWAWARGFALEQLGRMDGAEQVASYREVALELDNLVTIVRDAIDAVESADPAPRAQETVAVVAALLTVFWTIRSAHSEVIDFAPRVVRALRGYDPDADAVAPTAFLLALSGTTLLLAQQRAAFPAISALRHLVARHTIPQRRTAVIAALVVRVDRPEEVLPLLHAARTDRDPATATWAYLLCAQFAENEGRAADALADSKRAYEIASRRGDTWSIATAATNIAQLYGQSGRPLQALPWLERGREGMVALQADNDVQQQEWTEASILIGIDDDRASALFSAFVSRAADAYEQPPMANGYAGLAEVAAHRGDLEECALLYLRAEASDRQPSRLSSPWRRLLGAAMIARHVLDGLFEADHAARIARSLRARVIAAHRIRPDFFDSPVYGTAVFGVGLWLSARPDDAALSLRLIAVAIAMHARQDSPALRHDAHRARLVGLYGAEALDAAIAAALALSPQQRTAHALALLADPVLRVPSIR